tara:strand:- start:3468 stop:3968 length:501 start_codon:yes stop_codon:yes gene_type:complete
MANNQPHSSLFVVPNDTINIPQPGILTTGTNSSGGSNILTDAGQDFTPSVTNANGYNLISGIIYQAYTGVFPALVNTVLGVNSPTVLRTLGSTAAGAYNIYSSNQDGKMSFTLFIGTGGAGSTLRVLTAAGDDVTLTNLPDSSFVPLQVVRVFGTGTTCSEILALY